MTENPHRAWFESYKASSSRERFLERPVAYFCAEFALDNSLPIYAGGLGILAGDLVLEAAEQDFPMVAVGLRYKKGQWQREFKELGSFAPDNQPDDSFNLEVALNKNRVPVLISVPIFETTVHARAWHYKKGSVSLFLLDTDIEENNPHNRRITDVLYAEDRDMRLKQEILLGVGGYRLLAALGISPSVYHLNEGHSAFVALEIASDYIRKNGGGLLEACDKSCTNILFTNHTLIAAGHEVFSHSLVAEGFDLYAKEIGIQVSDILSLGQSTATDDFSMTALALKVSRHVNAVSKLHGQKALELWKEKSVGAVTNGVSLSRWDNIRSSDPAALASAHKKNKARLLAYIQAATGIEWEEGDLLAGWARRFVPYKRPLALLSDIARFKKIAAEENLRVVYAGPFDAENSANNPYVKDLMKLASGELKDLVAVIPHYNADLAGLLVSGTDIWLNTPIVGQEACGTSGMKAALNGSLPLSTNDGWVAEANLTDIGWIADDENIGVSILDILEREVLPLYHKDKESWVKRQGKAREMALRQFSATRMLRDYIEQFYTPIMSAH